MATFIMWPNSGLFCVQFTVTSNELVQHIFDSVQRNCFHPYPFTTSFLQFWLNGKTFRCSNQHSNFAGNNFESLNNIRTTQRNKFGNPLRNSICMWLRNCLRALSFWTVQRNQSKLVSLKNICCSQQLFKQIHQSVIWALL